MKKYDGDNRKNMSENKKNTYIFRPRARLMLLLGDQLIKDSGIAIFEMVKNAYDADATRCNITLQNVVNADDTSKIIIEDDGHGMDFHTVTNVWLEPATEYRKDQRETGGRSLRFGRLPLGEKGVGRFAVHKLGRKVRLITRGQMGNEVVVEIDWNLFEKAAYLSDIPVDVSERIPVVFKGNRTGTRIEISDLRDREWNRHKVRTLSRSITSICSPFGGPDKFETELILLPECYWLKGLLQPDEVQDEALFRFSGKIDGDVLRYDYKFTPRGRMDLVDERQVTNQNLTIKMPMMDPEIEKQKKVFINLKKYRIGPVTLDFHIFDLEPMVFALTTSDRAGLKEYLSNNGGIRLYKDGVRVYDFGEPGNDWLELGGRRINTPASKISNNQIIGAVQLKVDSSDELVEKTNREGFVENEAYEALRQAVRFAIIQAEAERNKDKKRIRAQYSKGKKKEPVIEDLILLRSEVERHNLSDSLGPYIDRIELQYREVQTRLLVAAGAGLNLAAVMHEVEKGIQALHNAIVERLDYSHITILSKNLSDMIDGLNWLLRKSGKAKIRARALVEQSLFNSKFRFEAHKVIITNGFETGNPDFQLNCSRRLIMSAITNLIDNSIYWLENKGAMDKRIFMGTSYEPNGKPSIIIADNGPGFIDPQEYIVQPFFTRKSDGMGLGLHITDEIMKSHNGRLLFPEHGDIGLPDEFSGAIVLLEFGGIK
ncbi:MAG: ATP-binding protein [Candidatus Xenobiia bacterium LiM19]